MIPRIQQIVVDKKRPFNGISYRLLTLHHLLLAIQNEVEYILENGIAPSRANAYVQRLAAVKLPTPAKNNTPRIKNNNPNPPPALPVTILNNNGIGCPVATLKRVCTSGN